MKKIFIGSLIFMFVSLTGCSTGIQTIGADAYYVQIQDDGENYEEEGNIRYVYDVVTYDQNGESMELSFTANHALKQGAYLKVFYKKEKVITYEEIEKEDIPEKTLQAIEG